MSVPALACAAMAARARCVRRACVCGAAGEGGTPTRQEVIGIVSLIFWALIIVVTIKSVFLLLRFDNKGEGGTLSLMALVRKAFSKPSVFLLGAGMLGASLFYADALITPAISVISSVEGLKAVPGVGGYVEPWVLPISIVILIGLFFVQSRGTARIGALFGPITLVWFATLAVGGLSHIADDPGILAAVDPRHAVGFMLRHGTIGLVKTLEYMGRITAGTHKIETPVGTVEAEVRRAVEQLEETVREIAKDAGDMTESVTSAAA